MSVVSDCVGCDASQRSFIVVRNSVNGSDNVSVMNRLNVKLVVSVGRIYIKLECILLKCSVSNVRRVTVVATMNSAMDQ